MGSHRGGPALPPPSPQLLPSRSVQKEELCSERSRLTSAAPPPSGELCDRAEPRHRQLLSSCLYLPLASALPCPPPHPHTHTRLPAATDAPGLVSITVSARMRRRRLSFQGRGSWRRGTARLYPEERCLLTSVPGTGTAPEGPWEEVSVWYAHQKTQPSSKRSH